MLTPYGEQILFVTKYVASTMGQEFEGAKMSIEMLKWAKTFGGRPDSALKTFMENMQHEKILWPECGADDYQAHIYMEIVPMVGRYAGLSELVD